MPRRTEKFIKKPAYDFWIQVLISMILLVWSLWIVSGAHGDQEKNWAYGYLGMIVAYWLKREPKRDY